MRLAFDTNGYSALQKRAAPRLAPLLTAMETEAIGLPFMVVAELKAGFLKGKQTQRNNQTLERFLAQDRVAILYADTATIDVYARLWAELVSLGKKIPTNDMWIAALCLRHGYVLATNDRHFQQVPLLQTVTVD